MFNASHRLPVSYTEKAMKKIYIFFFTSLMTVSCALQMFAPNATPTPAATSTNTSTPRPTLTPVTPSLTFTSTPTLSGFRTPTSTQESTQTAIASTFTPFAQFTPSTPTEIFNMQGFVFVNISGPQFYKGRLCQPAFVKITAQAGLSNTAHVLLFARFKSLKSETASEWTSIEMETIGGGTYVHDLYTDEMQEDEIFYQDNWVEYQIVATNSAGTEIGRTDIFKEKVKSLVCVPPTATIKP
jgi:hypothetical protein